MHGSIAPLTTNGKKKVFYVEESMSVSTKKVVWFGLAILVFSCIAAVQAQEKNDALDTPSKVKRG
jgi:hypothetical protein